MPRMVFGGERGSLIDGTRSLKGPPTLPPVGTVHRKLKDYLGATRFYVPEPAGRSCGAILSMALCADCRSLRSARRACSSGRS